MGVFSMFLACKDIIPKETTQKDSTLDYLVSRWLKMVEGDLPHAQWARDEVRKNTAKSLQDYRKVARDPRRVSVQKADGKYVIGIENSKGEEASLWLDEDGSVNSVTPY